MSMQPKFVRSDAEDRRSDLDERELLWRIIDGSTPADMSLETLFDRLERDRSRTRAPAVEEPEVPPSHSAEDLTQGGNLARINLDGRIYTLRITRQRKLILTK